MAEASETPNTKTEDPQPGDMPLTYKPLTLTIDFSTEALANASNAILQQYTTSFPPPQSVPSSITIQGSSPTANLTLLTSFFWTFPSQNAHLDT
ncbi:hypothetical protein IFR05_017048, partial [Cadophora sp. M221]